MAGSVPPNPLLLGSAVHIPADMAYELMMERQLETARRHEIDLSNQDEDNLLDLEEDVGDEGKERSLSHRAAGPLSGNPAIVGAALFSAVRHVRGAFMKPAGAIAGAFSALGPVASLGVKLGALRLARTALPPAHTAAQIISLMVPVLRASGVGPRLGAAWGPLSGTSRTLQGAIVASAAIDGLRLARGALSLQSSESVGPDRLGSSLGQGPHKMASLVPRFKHVVQRLKRRLASLGAVLPADRFDASDAELMRFLVACDLLSKPQGNQDAIDAVVTTAAKKVMDAAEWRAHYPFLTRPERRRWKKYVFFHKRDAARRPVLFFNFDRAALELPASETSELVRAIVSQVEHGCTSKLSDGPKGAEQIVVVVKCTESSILSAKRMISVLRPIVSVLQRAYPERLSQLFLVGLPGVLGAVANMVRRLLPPRTQDKMRVVSQFDPDLPPLPGLSALADSPSVSPSSSGRVVKMTPSAPPARTTGGRRSLSGSRGALSPRGGATPSRLGRIGEAAEPTPPRMMHRSATEGSWGSRGGRSQTQRQLFVDGDRDSPRKRSVPATPSTEGYVYEDAMEEDVVGMAGPDSYEEDGSGGEGYLPAWKAQALDYGRTVIPVFAGVLLLYQVAAQLGYS